MDSLLDVAGFPKLTSTPIRRDAVTAWLQFYANMPLRYIAGPTGSGKTTAAHLYARDAGRDIRYIRLCLGTTPATFVASLERILDASVDVERPFAAFPADAHMELVIDEIDHADAAVRSILAELPSRVPSNVTLIYLARSRRVVDLVSLVTQGTAVIMDRTALAFTPRETAELCDALGHAHSAADVQQLIRATEGWAFAVTGTLRDAAYESQGLRGAFARWYERHARLISGAIERSLAGLTPDERAAAERIYAGEEPGNDPAYAHLHDCGLLLTFSDAELRPLRAIAPSASQAAYRVEPLALPTARIEMFGEFSMEIDGRRVEWIRRRDRQLVAFIALQPRNAARRALLLQTFWPDAEPHLASQSLRTACCTIRRAIAQCVGYDRVDHYFVGGAEVRLKSENVSITSESFLTHMRAADEAAGSGEESVARRHYVAACGIHASRLLECEGNEPWLRETADAFAEMALTAKHNLSELRRRRRIEGPFMSPLPALSESA